MEPDLQPSETWPQVGLVRTYFPGTTIGPYIGTGTLIHPRAILTAAHNLYDKSHGGRTRRVEVSFPGGLIVGSTAFDYVQEWETTTTGDVNSQSVLSPYDCGVIFLDTAVSDSLPRARVMSPVTLEAASALPGVWVVGYPSDPAWPYPPGSMAGGYSRPLSQSPRPYRMSYPTNSLGGMSGGPVGYLDGDGRLCVVAVNTSQVPVQDVDMGNGLLIYEGLGKVIEYWVKSVSAAA